MSFSNALSPVVNVHVSGDVFGFVVNSINGVSACFLVGRCDVVHEQFVVRSFVDFVVVCCFIGRYKCFGGIIDFLDVVFQFVLEIVMDLSEFYILYHVVYVRFKFVEFLVLWRAFPRLEAEIVILGVVVVVSAVFGPVLVFILFEEKGFPAHTLDDAFSHFNEFLDVRIS